jgi:hypothetical protein
MEREVGEAKLTCAEGNDAANRVVRRDAHGNPIARHDFDTEPPHAATELGKYLVAGVALHAVEPTAVYRDDGTLNVNQIVLTQSASFRCYASIVPHTGTMGKGLEGSSSLQPPAPSLKPPAPAHA